MSGFQAFVVVNDYKNHHQMVVKTQSWGNFPASQRGMALMLIVFFLGLMAVAGLLNALNGNQMRIERDNRTAAALAEAKAALNGYVALKTDLASKTLGKFPLPDMGNGISLSEGDAAGNFAGNTSGISLIGRLPWKSLGLSVLRSADSECLWYALSGTFKNTPITNGMPNWDSLGQIDVVDANGNSVASNLVALVVAPGMPLDGQDRTSDSFAVQCGGNYDARNYLDAYSAANAIGGGLNYFSGSVNNSKAPDTTNKIFVQAKSDHYNDRFLMISVDDVFNVLIHRSDFSAQISALLDDSDFITNLKTTVIAGSKGSDNVNNAFCNSIANINNKIFCTNWKEMLLLTQLPALSPITIDGATTPNCTRVVIFGGKRTGTQVRLTSADKNDPANYLEGANLANFATPTAISNSFKGVSSFSASKPSADILRCLQ